MKDTLFWHIFRSLRPRQWIKNGFVLLPLLFAQELFQIESVLLTIEAVVIFCILSSAVYLINDIADLDEDRNHPEKKYRPLAAGYLSLRLVWMITTALLLTSLLWGVLLGTKFFLILIIYFMIQVVYTFFLKRTVILDVFCISSGFFLRVVAGAVAIQVMISRWLIICTILIAMFLSLAKRRHELTLMGAEDAGNHRKVLSEYTPYLLDQMIGVITAATLLSYMLYCVSPETVEKFNTDRLIYTFPFVLYGIFRYLYLIHKRKQGGAPEKVLLTDLPLMVSVVLWGFCSMLIIYGVV